MNGEQLGRRKIDRQAHGTSVFICADNITKAEFAPLDRPLDPHGH